jgi:hypothetical protein
MKSITLRSRALRAAIGALALVITTSALSYAGDTDDRPDPTAGAPAVGACYDITYRQASQHAIPEKTVSCRKRHAGLVAAVGRLPAGFDWTYIDPDESLSDRLNEKITGTCERATAKILGTDQVARFRSLYYRWSYRPTDAQVEDGARWFSCVIVLAEASKLLPLGRHQLRHLTNPPPSSVARCANRRGRYVVCAHTHAWRASWAAVVHEPLTDRRLKATVRNNCPRHVSSRSWLYASKPLTARSFVYACFAKTRH